MGKKFSWKAFFWGFCAGSLILPVCASVYWVYLEWDGRRD